MASLDIIVPDQAGPTVMVHKGWKVKSGPTATNVSVSPQNAISSKDASKGPTGGRQFEFVQETKPTRYRDPALQKQVRSHVRKETVRAEKEAQRGSRSKAIKPTKEKEKVKCTHVEFLNSQEDKSLISSRAIVQRSDTLMLRFGNPTALITYKYPIAMTPHDHELLSNYIITFGKGMFPLKTLTSNPLMSPAWFHFAASDEAMLHAVLYSAAIYIALLQGKQEDQNTMYHQSRILSILRKRLMLPKEAEGKEESTLGAISCLALGEAVSGNRERWLIHMRAIKELVQGAGGMGSMRPIMQAKLYRSDITGAIDYVESPLLDFKQCMKSSRVWKSIPPSRLKDAKAIITETLERCSIDPILIASMIEVTYFSLAIQNESIAIEPRSFSDDMYRIEYDLLLISRDDNMINEACRIGGLLYMKALLQEWPHSSSGPSILLSQLHTALSQIPIQDSSLPLLLWLGLLGGLFRRGEERAWFVVYLASLGTTIPSPVLGDEICVLSRLLDLRNVFGAALLADLWKDVSKLQRLLAPAADIHLE